MTLSTVPGVSTGDLMTAANWNTQVRDNINGLNPYITRGDMVFAASADTLARLAKGTVGQYLGITSGIPAWKDDGVPGILAAAGDLVYGTSANVPEILSIGNVGQYLGVIGTIPAWKNDGVPGIFAAAGDLVYGDDLNSSARLPKGTARQVLAMNAGETSPEWINNSVVKYYETLYTTPAAKSGSSSYSDIANSSQVISISRASKIVVTAKALITAGASNMTINMMVSIDGTRVGYEDHYDDASEISTLVVSGSKSVDAGNRTVVLQSKDQFSRDYTVQRLIVQIWVLED